MNTDSLAAWSYADYERALSETIDRAARLETQARRVCRASAMGYTETCAIEIARMRALLDEFTADAQSVLDARRAEFAAAGGAAC